MDLQRKASAAVKVDHQREASAVAIKAKGYNQREAAASASSAEDVSEDCSKFGDTCSELGDCSVGYWSDNASVGSKRRRDHACCNPENSVVSREEACINVQASVHSTVKMQSVRNHDFTNRERNAGIASPRVIPVGLCGDDGPIASCDNAILQVCILFSFD